MIEATLEILAEVGFTSLTIDAVAQRAGSNRVLIYRVWDTKVALVTDALFGSAADLVVPDTGSTAQDLRRFIGQLVATMSRPAHLNGVPGLTVEMLRDKAGFKEIYLRYIKPAEDGFGEIFDRARIRGELTGDVDAKLVTYAVSGAATSLAQAMSLSQETITDAVLKTVVGGLVELDVS